MAQDGSKKKSYSSPIFDGVKSTAAAGNRQKLTYIFVHINLTGFFPRRMGVRTSDGDLLWTEKKLGQKPEA
jgi:hypothetical protein